jgi:plastocyanin
MMTAKKQDQDALSDPSVSSPAIVTMNNTKRFNWRINKKLLLLIGIPLVIGAVAAIVATVLYVRKLHTEQPVMLSASVVYVDITATGYTPSTIKVKRGQLITWKNTEALPHRLMADPDKLPAFETMELLNKGDSYTYIFDKQGSFKYYDPDNPKVFVGTVVVE